MKSTPHSMQRRTLLQAASLTPVAAATLAPAAGPGARQPKV